MSAPARLIDARYGVVLRALEGFRNTHAMAVLLGGFLLVGLVLGLGNGLAIGIGSPLLAALLNFVGLVLAVSVVNAAGLALMDAARAQGTRGFVDLLVAGAGCFAKFLAILILLGLGVLVFLLAAAILLYVCKIPFLGPVLLAVVLPLLILLTSALMLAVFVALSLVAPALWEGHSIRGAITRLVAVVRLRPLEVLISLMLLGLLTGVIASMVGIFVFSGTTTIGGLAASILGSGMMGALGGMGAMGGMGGMEGMGGMPGMEGMGGGMGGFEGPSTGLMIAGGIGLGVVFALVSGALAAIQMNGLCHIYLQASEGVDDSAADESVGRSMASARAMMDSAGARMANAAQGISAKAQEARAAAASRRAERAEPTPAPQPPPAADLFSAAAPPPTAAGATCPACRAPIASDDRFCGECGHRLAR